MYLLNLSINRIIIHQIHRRETDGSIKPPMLSNVYTLFDNPAMMAFKRRVNDALGENSKAVQMEITNQGQNDIISLVDQMIDQDEKQFIKSSFEIANKLSRAQDRKNYPGGILVIFLGTQGANSKTIFGIIKAEVHSGYEKHINKSTNEISLKFIQELLLTPSSRMYKTAGFFEKENYDGTSKDLNDKWMVLVSDFQIGKGKDEGKPAAQYFYEAFLGCGHLQTSARTTKQFYDAAINFIENQNISASERNDLLNALTTYLKVDISPIANISEFGSRYFSIDTQDLFSEHMEKAGVPKTGFTKDIEYIKGKLKFRKIKFSSNIRIIAPAETFKKLVAFKTIDGGLDESGNPAEWTEVIIKDRIAQQE